MRRLMAALAVAAVTALPQIASAQTPLKVGFIGTFSGQSSMTVQVDTSCFGRRRFGLEAAWLGFVGETDRRLRRGFDIHSVSLEWQGMGIYRCH